MVQPGRECTTLLFSYTQVNDSEGSIQLRLPESSGYAAMLYGTGPGPSFFHRKSYILVRYLSYPSL